MSNKHTPGPWFSRTNTSGSLDLFGEDGARVILCNARLINQEANARLIAAAPDLLEVLQDFSSAVWSDCRLSADVRNDLQAMYRNSVLPAISKATGAKP